MYLACGALSKDEFRAKLSVYGDPDPILSTQPNHILSELIVWQYWYAYRTIVMRDIVRSPWHQSVPARKYDFLGVPDTLVPFRGGAGGASSDPDAVRDFLVYGGPMGWQEVRILRSPEGAGVKYRSLAFDRLLKTVSMIKNHTSYVFGTSSSFFLHVLAFCPPISAPQISLTILPTCR